MKTKTCPTCQTSFQAQTKLCPECHKAKHVRTCSYCHLEYHKDAPYTYENPGNYPNPVVCTRHVTPQEKESICQTCFVKKTTLKTYKRFNHCDICQRLFIQDKNTYKTTCDYCSSIYTSYTSFGEIPFHLDDVNDHFFIKQQCRFIGKAADGYCSDSDSDHFSSMDEIHEYYIPLITKDFNFINFDKNNPLIAGINITSAIEPLYGYGPEFKGLRCDHICNPKINRGIYNGTHYKYNEKRMQFFIVSRDNPYTDCSNHVTY